MKKKAIPLLLLTLLTACLKENDCLDPGIITGLDERDCMCCGGWFIEIRDTMRRFDQIPADCTIDFSTVIYPVKVKVQWAKKDTMCVGDEIRVTRLEPDR